MLSVLSAILILIFVRFIIIFNHWWVITISFVTSGGTEIEGIISVYPEINIAILKLKEENTKLKKEIKKNGKV